MRSIVIAALLVFGLLSPVRAAGPEPVDVELILAVDVSRSIDPQEQSLQFSGYAAAFRDPKIIDGIRGGPLGAIAVMLFTWSDHNVQEVLVPWMLIHDAASARAFADAIDAAPKQARLYTSISGAIAFGVRQFGQGFEGTRRVMDISGDGVNNSGPSVAEARDAAVAQGVTINGLAIIDASPGAWAQYQPSLDEYYRNEVIGGVGCFLVVAEGFHAFEDAVKRKLVREIAMSWPENDPTVLRVGVLIPSR